MEVSRHYLGPQQEEHPPAHAPRPGDKEECGHRRGYTGYTNPPVRHSQALTSNTSLVPRSKLFHSDKSNSSPQALMCHCKFCQRRCPIFSVERDTKFLKKISLLVLTLVMMGTSLQGKLNSSKYLNEFPSCVVVTLACDRVVSRGRDWHLVTSPGGRRSVGDWREGRGGARRRTEPPLSTS